MSIACLNRLCCRSSDDESDRRPEIVVISNQPHDDNYSAMDSGFKSDFKGDKFVGKADSCGSVSEEDSGVGSHGSFSEGQSPSDISEAASDTASQIDSQPEIMERTESGLSEFEKILPTKENQDLTAEIALELKQMNGFSLEADGNTRKNIHEFEGNDKEQDSCQAEKKKKRKRRKHRKVARDHDSEEVKEF